MQKAVIPSPLWRPAPPEEEIMEFTIMKATVYTQCGKRLLCKSTCLIHIHMKTKENVRMSTMSTVWENGCVCNVVMGSDEVCHCHGNHVYEAQESEFSPSATKLIHVLIFQLIH